MIFNPQALPRDGLAEYGVGRVRVAFSGGMDSHVLLHALSSLPSVRPRLQAVHVHHGLQAAAEGWSRHCRTVCERMGVPFQLLRVDGRPAPGESPEAAAREARYAALAGMLDQGDVLCTAHHRDDQAETVLLQMMRGAGPRGLAAMPAERPLGKGRHRRPLLAWSRQALRDYAVQQGLDWVEDPSNRETRLGRNHLRHRVLPVLAERWPAAADSLVQVARWQADGDALLDDLAELDLGDCVVEGGSGLNVAVLRTLSPGRQRNLLRYWLRGRGLPVPGHRRLRELRLQILQAAADAVPQLHWPGAVAGRFRDVLYAWPEQDEPDSGAEWCWYPDEELKVGGGRLTAERVRGRGLCSETLSLPLTVRLRRGGERCRPLGRRHSQTLKRLFQEYRVPPWLRARIPLIYDGENMVAAAGLWVCHGYAADIQQAGLSLQWQANAVPPMPSSSRHLEE